MKSAARARMLLVGDISAAKHPKGLRFLLERAVPALQHGDIVYGNLERPITNKGQFIQSRADKPEGREMKPKDARALRAAGFHVVSLANNHMMDFGAEGLLQTIELLDSQGIAHCGGGRNLSEARKLAVVKRNGVHVAFLSYTSVFTAPFPATNERPGMATVAVETTFKAHPKTFESPGVPPIVITTPNQDDMDSLRTDIRQAKASADLVVVAWHWGLSHGHRKRVSYQMECGRAAIDAGASLVIGHHPHVLQGVEVYRKGVIFYSLGDFAFFAGGPPADTHDRNTLLVDCEIDKAGLRSVALRPVRINSEVQPEVIQDGKGSRGLEALVRDSEDFKTVFRDDGDRLVLELPKASRSNQNGTRKTATIQEEVELK